MWARGSGGCEPLLACTQALSPSCLYLPKAPHPAGQRGGEGRGLAWSGKAGGGVDFAPRPWHFAPTVHRAVGGGLSDTPTPSYSSTAQLTRQLLSVSSVLGPVLGGCLPATDMCLTGV